jgi:hypothetical protein
MKGLLWGLCVCTCVCSGGGGCFGVCTCSGVVRHIVALRIKGAALTIRKSGHPLEKQARAERGGGPCSNTQRWIAHGVAWMIRRSLKRQTGILTQKHGSQKEQESVEQTKVGVA